MGGIRILGRIALLAALALGLAGCSGGGGGAPGSSTPVGGGGGGTTTVPVVLTSISITPANPAALPAGLTQQFTATGSYSDNTSAPLASVTWSSSNTAAATIGASGLAKGVAGGTFAYITASAGGVTSNMVVLNVTAATVTSLAITPASATVGIGQPVQFKANATYSDNSTADATASANWSSSSSVVATLNAPPNTLLAIPGDVTGVSPGAASITATFGAASAVVAVTVTNTYAVDGRLTGLPASGVSVTIADGADTLTITNNTGTATNRQPFYFNTTLAAGSAYNVTVLTQPPAPAHPCTVVDGSGVINAATPIPVTWPQVVCQAAVGTIAGYFQYGSNNFYGGYVNSGIPTNAQFYWPAAIAFDTLQAGNMYVADSNNNAIRLVAASGVVSTFAGPQPAAAPASTPTTTGFVGTAGAAGYANSATPANALFSHPMGIAVDKSGNLYVGDMNNNVIRMITPSGAVSTLAGALPATGGAPAATGFSTGATTLAAAQFNAPGTVVMDGNGNIYVADTMNYAIRKIIPAGASAGVSTLAGSGLSGYVNGTGTAAQFNSVSALAVDPTNTYLYVADTCLVRQVVIAAGATYGQVTTLTGPNTTGVSCGYQDGAVSSALFFGISGLAFDSLGKLYVGDFANNVIRVITPGGVPALLSTGTVNTVAGNAVNYVGSFADGPASSAAFSPSTKGFVIDASNNLIFTDSSNQLIRKYTP